MVLAEQQGSTRSYLINLNNRVYELKKIHLYEIGKGIVLTKSRGWFEKKDKWRDVDIEKVELGEVKFKTKRTASFNGELFIMPVEKSKWDIHLQAELYLPINDTWVITEELETFDSLKDVLLRYYHNTLWGCDFRQHIRFIEKENKVAFTEKIRDLLKTIFGKDLQGEVYINWNYIADNEEKIKEKIKEVAKELNMTEVDNNA